MAIAGLLSWPAVTSVIAGATSPEQIRANAAAATWQLTGDEIVALDEILGWSRQTDAIAVPLPGRTGGCIEELSIRTRVLDDGGSTPW